MGGDLTKVSQAVSGKSTTDVGVFVCIISSTLRNARSCALNMVGDF